MRKIRPEEEKKKILLSLIITLSVVAATVIVPIGYFAYHFVKETYINQIFEDNANYAETIAFIVKDELQRSSPEEVLRKINQNLDSYKVSRGGYICMYDSSGRLLVHPNQEWVEQKKYVGSNKLFPSEGGVCQLIDLVKEKKNYVGLYNSSTGEKQVGAFYYIEDVGWVVGIHQPYSNVQEVVDKIKFIVGLASVSMILFIPLISIMLMNKGIQPYFNLLEESLKQSVKLHRELKDYSEKLEEKVRERTKKLEESEKKYRRLVENSSDGIFRVNEEGRITFCNKRMEGITGVDRRALIGKRLLDLFDPESVEIIQDRLKKTSSHEQISLYGMNLVRKDGRKGIVDLSFSSIFKNGRRAGWQGIARDVSERKEMERQIIQSEKLASIGKLAAGVAHEINNPLANIALYSHMLLKKTKSDEEKQKLKVIVTQAERATNIVRNLLDFSRQREPEITEVDVNALLSETLSIMEHQLRRSGISLVKNLNAEVPEILADPGQLQQVFFNIITNAIEAMGDGGTLTVSTDCQGDIVEVRISDTGSGIAKEHLGRIFDPFFTTKEVGKGTGLGLSVSLGIIERHRGSIEVDSEIGKGATFIIKLPLEGLCAESDKNPRG
jgi:PAS domain S-box-containing protein